jgi:hypothetical protein
MDDYSLTNLYESRNEFTARLVNLLTPHMIHGFQTMFNEAWKLCSENDETDKYLMTFQNFLSRVPKWNSTIINTECARIKEASSCNYLEELIACVHVVQLKSLTCMRVGMKNKKINVDVPKATEFIHNAYIHAARKLYANMYLYEKTANTLATQRNRREIELIVKECILNAMRDSIPIEKLIRSYMDPTIEEDVEVSEETKILKEEPIIEAGAGASGVDVDLGSGEEAMPGLAPSKSKLITATAATGTTGADDADSVAGAEQASVLERLEAERLKTAEAKELEAMREILAEVDTTTNYSYSSSQEGVGVSAGAEVKFNDDIMVKSIDPVDAEADRESRRGYGDTGDGDGDDVYESNTLRIGDSVNLDIGAEPVDGGDSISILDDIQVLS